MKNKENKKCYSCNGTGLAHKYDSAFLHQGLKKVEPETECEDCKGSGFDTKYTDNLICPYCGYEDQDSWELGSSDSNYQCGNCDKKFSWETDVVRTFISTRVACLNGSPHRFGEPWKPWADKEVSFVNCKDCNYREKRGE